jgi:2-polyprenyl-3-methyl-5-hydroxy-6-metoxy-1,4-benzoquinol methylase
MNEFENVNCLVCGENNYHNYSDKGQFNLPTHVVICKHCGFSYLNPRWSNERYNAFYKNEYDDYYRPEVKSKYTYDVYLPIKNNLKRLDKFGYLKNQPENIIDIGCGMGDSLIYLKQQVFKTANYYAIEPSSFCQQHLSKNGIELLSTDVNADWSNGNENKFDVVIMRHVLEHFLDPIAVLKKAASILKKDGLLIIAVPNAKKPTKRLIKNYFRVVHVSYFSKTSLTNALSLSGLKPGVLLEGDEFDAYELFCVAQKTNDELSVKFDKEECQKQIEVYNQTKKLDFYYDFKALVWKLINKVKSN